MLNLVFVACLLGSDGKPTVDCQNYSMQFAEQNLTPYQCAMQAQPELAKWSAEHPGRVITRYGCKPLDLSGEQEA